MATLNTKIVLRNDTVAAWAEHNPVLLAGEVGVENDTGYFKVGNGTATWNALAYANKFEGGAASTASHYEGTAELLEDGETYETDMEVIARVLADVVANKDDVFIVKRLIADDKYSYTAYIYNGTDWAAMDGNYSADNVYFDSDLIATANIGVVTVGDSGSTTIAATGKNLSSVLASIMAERKEPEATKPTASIKFTNATKAVEVGTIVTPTYSASLTAGSYTYGPATGISAQSWTVKDNLATPNTLTTDSGSFPEIQLGDQTNDVATYKLTATATYNAGAIPVDNLGDPVESKQIAAGEASASTATNLTCYRNYYYGILETTAEEEPLTSDVIRTSLVAGGAYNAKKTFSVYANSVDNPKRIVVAYPANTSRGGLNSVILPNSLNYNAFANGDYQQVENVNVEGANNYTAIPYTVYVYAPAVIDSGEQHDITLA